jgi:hypothetical protein
VRHGGDSTSILVTDPSGGTEKRCVLGRALFGEDAASDDALWADVGPRLLKAVSGGEDSAVVAFGGRRSGKSRVVWGGQGAAKRFAEATFENDCTLEVAAQIIIDEEVLDALAPQRINASNNALEKWDVSWHTCVNAEEWHLLINDVFTTKAALFLHRDGFSHAAHVVFRCRVWSPGAENPANTTTFVDVGSSIIAGDDGDDSTVSTEISLKALREMMDSSVDAVAVAETSALTRLLPQQIVWVGCVSANMLDFQETRQTLALLEAAPEDAAIKKRTLSEDISALEAAQLVDGASPVNNATVAKLKGLLNNEAANWAARVSRTQELLKERRRWYTSNASQADVENAGALVLANVSDDAMCGGRLRYVVAQGRDLVFGCDISRRSGFVHVGLACIQKEHVTVSYIKDVLSVQVLGAGAFSTVRKNGEEVSNAELGVGDTLLIGQSLLLRVVTNCEARASSEALDSKDGGVWRKAMRSFHRETTSAVWTKQRKPSKKWALRHVENNCAEVLRMVHEANGLADELHKDVKFSVKASKDADPLDTDALLNIIVESDDVPASWRPRKLAYKLCEMRKCRRRFLEVGGDLEKLSVEFPKSTGGFFDAPLAHQLVGIAVVYLDALTYLIDIDDDFDIISFQGDVVGSVQLHVQAKIKSDDAEDGDDDVPCVGPWEAWGYVRPRRSPFWYSNTLQMRRRSSKTQVRVGGVAHHQLLWPKCDCCSPRPTGVWPAAQTVFRSVRKDSSFPRHKRLHHSKMLARHGPPELRRHVFRRRLTDAPGRPS